MLRPPAPRRAHYFWLCTRRLRPSWRSPLQARFNNMPPPGGERIDLRGAGDAVWTARAWLGGAAAGRDAVRERAGADRIRPARRRLHALHAADRRPAALRGALRARRALPRLDLLVSRHRDA